MSHSDKYVDRLWAQLMEANTQVGALTAENKRLAARLAAAEEAVNELRAMNERAREEAA